MLTHPRAVALIITMHRRCLLGNVGFSGTFSGGNCKPEFRLVPGCLISDVALAQPPE